MSPPAKHRAGRCPQCGARTAAGAENPFRPFCSERCKLADLGQWFAGRYAIPAEEDNEVPADAPQEPQSRQ